MLISETRVWPPQESIHVLLVEEGHIFVGTGSGAIVVYGLTDLRHPVGILQGHSKPITGLQVLPERLPATASKSASSSSTSVLKKPPTAVSELAEVDKPIYLYSGGEDGCLLCWDVAPLLQQNKLGRRKRHFEKLMVQLKTRQGSEELANYRVPSSEQLRIPPAGLSSSKQGPLIFHNDLEQENENPAGPRRGEVANDAVFPPRSADQRGIGAEGEDVAEMLKKPSDEAGEQPPVHLAGQPLQEQESIEEYDSRYGISSATTKSRLSKEGRFPLFLDPEAEDAEEFVEGTIFIPERRKEKKKLEEFYIAGELKADEASFVERWGTLELASTAVPSSSSSSSCEEPDSTQPTVRGKEERRKSTTSASARTDSVEQQQGRDRVEPHVEATRQREDNENSSGKKETTDLPASPGPVATDAAAEYSIQGVELQDNKVQLTDAESVSSDADSDDTVIRDGIYHRFWGEDPAGASLRRRMRRSSTAGSDASTLFSHDEKSMSSSSSAGGDTSGEDAHTADGARVGHDKDAKKKSAKKGKKKRKTVEQATAMVVGVPPPKRKKNQRSKEMRAQNAEESKARKKIDKPKWRRLRWDEDLFPDEELRPLARVLPHETHPLRHLVCSAERKSVFSIGSDKTLRRMQLCDAALHDDDARKAKQKATALSEAAGRVVTVGGGSKKDTKLAKEGNKARGRPAANATDRARSVVAALADARRGGPQMPSPAKLKLPRDSPADSAFSDYPPLSVRERRASEPGRRKQLRTPARALTPPPPPVLENVLDGEILRPLTEDELRRRRRKREAAAELWSRWQEQNRVLQDIEQDSHRFAAMLANCDESLRKSLRATMNMIRTAGGQTLAEVAKEYRNSSNPDAAKFYKKIAPTLPLEELLAVYEQTRTQRTRKPQWKDPVGGSSEPAGTSNKETTSTVGTRPVHSSSNANPAIAATRTAIAALRSSSMRAGSPKAGEVEKEFTTKKDQRSSLPPKRNVTSRGRDAAPRGKTPVVSASLLEDADFDDAGEEDARDEHMQKHNLVGPGGHDLPGQSDDELDEPVKSRPQSRGDCLAATVLQHPSKSRRNTTTTATPSTSLRSSRNKAGLLLNTTAADENSKIKLVVQRAVGFVEEADGADALSSPQHHISSPHKPNKPPPKPQLSLIAQRDKARGIVRNPIEARVKAEKEEKKKERKKLEREGVEYRFEREPQKLLLMRQDKILLVGLASGGGIVALRLRDSGPAECMANFGRTMEIPSAKITGLVALTSEDSASSAQNARSSPAKFNPNRSQQLSVTDRTDTDGDDTDGEHSADFTDFEGNPSLPHGKENLPSPTSRRGSARSSRQENANASTRRRSSSLKRKKRKKRQNDFLVTQETSIRVVGMDGGSLHLPSTRNKPKNKPKKTKPFRVAACTADGTISFWKLKDQKHTRGLLDSSFSKQQTLYDDEVDLLIDPEPSLTHPSTVALESSMEHTKEIKLLKKPPRRRKSVNKMNTDSTTGENIKDGGDAAQQQLEQTSGMIMSQFQEELQNRKKNSLTYECLHEFGLPCALYCVLEAKPIELASGGTPATSSTGTRSGQAAGGGLNSSMLLDKKFNFRDPDAIPVSTTVYGGTEVGLIKNGDLVNYHRKSAPVYAVAEAILAGRRHIFFAGGDGVLRCFLEDPLERGDAGKSDGAGATARFHLNQGSAAEFFRRVAPAASSRSTHRSSSSQRRHGVAGGSGARPSTTMPAPTMNNMHSADHFAPNRVMTSQNMSRPSMQKMLGLGLPVEEMPALRARSTSPEKPKSKNYGQSLLATLAEQVAEHNVLAGAGASNSPSKTQVKS
ncbi:unnamed protein product [Amoebophrya sp. A120]|nr:unnamed protein product [Amoebophrya sp. A120]|eukprot:GSA120T00001536001.1